MMKDEANEQVNEIPAVTGIGDISTGLGSKDPAVQAKINDIMKLRAGDYGRSAIGGAAMGAQAAQGAGSPLNAFIQGMAAGLQAPAQIYQAKKAQVKSVLDATPFGVTHPEVVKDPEYKILAGLPTGVVLPAIAKIAQDAVKAHIEGQEARKTEEVRAIEARKEGRVTPETSIGYAQIYAKNTGKTIDPNIFVGMQEKEVADYVNSGGVDTSKTFANEKDLRSEFINQVKAENFSVARDNYASIVDAAKYSNDPASDMKMVFSYMKLLDPTSTVREGEYATAENARGIPQTVINAYNKAKDGQILTPMQKQQFLGQATDSWKRKVDSFKSTVTTYRDLAKNNGFDPNKVVVNIGDVLSYADPTKHYAPPVEAPEKATPKLGDVFSETKDGWVSTYKVIEVNGKLARKRISAVQDTEGK